MIFVLWEFSDYEWHVSGIYKVAEQAFEARGIQWKISVECYGKLNPFVKWASYNDRDERSHLALMNGSFVGIDRVVKLLNK